MTTIPDIQAYRTLVFDCDGVVLDSNLVKTQAFYDTALPYGIEAARQIVEYHTVRGGVSRYKKFEHFIEHILQRESEPDLLQPLLDEFSRNVRTGLLHCNVASRLEELRAQTPKATWMIVSGGDQAELRSIFTERGLQELFDGGIYGSPDTKDTILRREIANGTLEQPGLFLGDSRYDHQAATDAGLNFLFVSGWTEVSDWSDFVGERAIPVVGKISELLAPTDRESEQ